MSYMTKRKLSHTVSATTLVTFTEHMNATNHNDYSTHKFVTKFSCYRACVVYVTQKHEFMFSFEHHCATVCIRLNDNQYLYHNAVTYRHWNHRMSSLDVGLCGCVSWWMTTWFCCSSTSVLLVPHRMASRQRLSQEITECS